VFNTHGARHNVFWSYATVSGRSVCTVTLMIAIFASVQNVPFVCVHPIGSYILGRGGNITIGNYACRAGQIGRRRMELNAQIRDALISKLGTSRLLQVSFAFWTLLPTLHCARVWQNSRCNMKMSIRRMRRRIRTMR
jgi:hypothetical protein